tara:strand:- start:2155 stop:2613 length:459 start_codon:yes stop_codon:yes gene_type:complete
MQLEQFEVTNLTKQISKKLSKELLEDLALLFPQDKIGPDGKPQLEATKVSAWLRIQGMLESINNPSKQSIPLGHFQVPMHYIIKGADKDEELEIKVGLGPQIDWTSQNQALVIELTNTNDVDKCHTLKAHISQKTLLDLQKYASTGVTQYDI